MSVFPPDVEAHVDAAVREVVAKAPPLTAAQIGVIRRVFSAARVARLADEARRAS
jgi:hypothetical protein